MGADFPTGGTITLAMQGAPHTSVTIRVGASGHFRTSVPPGNWIVTGRTPKYGDNMGVCREFNSYSVNVTVNHLASVTVWCTEK